LSIIAASAGLEARHAAACVFAGANGSMNQVAPAKGLPDDVWLGVGVFVGVAVLVGVDAGVAVLVGVFVTFGVADAVGEGEALD
jgi:hypothetical protein